MKSTAKNIFGFAVGVVFTVFLLSVCADSPHDQAGGVLQMPATNAAAVPAQDEIANSRQNAITRAIASVSPSVVSINTRRLQEYYRQNPFAFDPFWRYLIPQYDRVMREVQALGSGFIISPQGHILTNQHVVESAEEIIVTLPGGEKFEAEKIGEDFRSDVAVIQIKGKDFSHAPLGNSDDVIIGEWSIAIGNPFGLFDVTAKPTVTVGVISAVDLNFGRLDNQRTYDHMIQTDAAINSGNSGGPLVNSDGNVIGMNAFIYSGSENSGTNIGLGFAIPINHVRMVADNLIKHGAMPRDFWAGIQYQDITSTIALLLRMQSTSGVIITDVERNSPWDEAGLEVEDVLLAVNDIEINSSKDLDSLQERLKLKSGDELELKVYRNRRIYRARVHF